MLGLTYVSWADNSGYGVAAKAYLRALADLGAPVRWVPMMPDATGYRIAPAHASGEPTLDALCDAPALADTILVHTVPEYYPAWIARGRAEGKRVFGYTVWELEQLPDHWPAILNRLDGVLVPCRWNADVFRRSGVTVPIHVVPHLSQLATLPLPSVPETAAIEARLGGAAARAGRFVFYTIGAWTRRKAPDLVLEAYRRAFSAADPVLLVIKTGERDVTRHGRHWRDGFRRRHGRVRDTVRGKLAGGAMPPVALIDDEQLPTAQIGALHALGDCFVSLTRTEGWGLGAFEAALLGKPVVMTGYGGQRDFLDPTHSALIDFTMVRAEEPGWSVGYRSTDQWAEPDVAQAAARMRDIMVDPDAARHRAAAQAADLRSRFAPERVAKALLEAMR